MTAGRDNRLDWLDGTRALAIALVVLIHVGAGLAARGNLSGWLVPLSEGDSYGVQLFFAISAATIALTLSRQLFFAGWYIRRIFPIAPLYYAAIAFYGALMFLAPQGAAGNARLAGRAWQRRRICQSGLCNLNLNLIPRCFSFWEHYLWPGSLYLPPLWQWGSMQKIVSAR